MQDFKQLTEQLIHALELLESIYRNEEEVKRDRTFFLHVKRETTDYFNWLENWKTAALDLAFERKITVHPGQIDATVDNMKALIMHSYYKDVRKRRYMDIKNSCSLVFLQSIEE